MSRDQLIRNGAMTDGQIRALGVALVAIGIVSTAWAASASAVKPEFVGSFPIVFTAQSVLPLEPTFHTSSGTTVICKMAKYIGEIGAPMRITIEPTYTECKSGAFTCTSSSKELVGELNYLNAAKTLVGLELRPATGSVVAEFKCSVATVRVEGCMIAEASAFSPLELLFEENAGKTGQLWQKLEVWLNAGSPTACTLTALGGTAWLMERVKFSAGVEIK
jgi:hypothetical protein